MENENKLNELNAEGGITFAQKTKTYELVPEGEYEVVIDNVTPIRTSTGKKKLDIRFKIRDDVTQPCQRQCVFFSIFEDKDPRAASMGWYDLNVLQSLIGNTQIEPDDVVTFACADDCIQALVGMKMKLSVIHEEYDKLDGSVGTKASVKRWSFKPSAHRHDSAPVSAEPVSADVSNIDDIPF